MNATPDIHGDCSEQFEPLRAVFTDNFQKGYEKGASVAVMQGGKLVVDLWGGHLDAAETRPWQHDSVAKVFSTGKVPLILCAMMQMDRGLLDPDELVAHYWPEYGCNGKEKTTVGQLMSHQAGLPGWEPATPFVELCDWDNAVQILAEQKPWWEPGTRAVYHPETYGFLVGELIRRTSGLTPGEYLQQEVTSIIDADYSIGQPRSERHRLADLVYGGLGPALEGPELPLQPDRIVGIWEDTSRPEVMIFDSAFIFELVNDRLQVRWRKLELDSAGIPLDDVRFDGKRLEFKSIASGLTFVGELTEPDRLTGTLYIGMSQVKHTFKRVPEIVGLRGTREEQESALMLARAMSSAIPPRKSELSHEFPASNGVGNARSMARIGAIIANGGELDGHTFFSPDLLEVVSAEQSYAFDPVMGGNKIRYGLGFGLYCEEFSCASEQSLHWGGMGGSFCVMDPPSRTCISYVMNQMIGGGAMVVPRGDVLRIAYNDIVQGNT